MQTIKEIKLSENKQQTYTQMFPDTDGNSVFKISIAQS